MKRILLAVVTCLAIIVAGVFFTINHAEAKTVFARPSNTGCSAPVGGDLIGPCGTPAPGKASVKAPKRHWHRHWHFHRHFHFRHHHWSFHRHGGRHGHPVRGHHGRRHHH